MSRPNELAEPLEIAEANDGWAGRSLCAIRLDDCRTVPSRLNRPARILLQGDAFEVSYLASHADLVAIRDWTSKAIAALEAARPELADADEAPAADSPPAGERAPSPSEFLEQCRAHIAAAKDPDALGAWFRSEAQKALRHQHELMADEVDDLQAAVKARVTALRRLEG